MLRLAGHAPDEPHVRRYVAGLRRQAADVPGLRLEVHGTYEPHELPGLLADTDCVIVPSLVPETGGLVPREALALGVPVLVSRLGALPELVTEGENGFTFGILHERETTGVRLVTPEVEDAFRQLRRSTARITKR